jgi:D-lactate dehydrogenase (cytochrome)
MHARPPAGAVGRDLYRDDPDETARLVRDASHYPGGFAPLVAYPRNEAEVAAVLAAHARVLPVGAQSSLTGGATPMGDVVLSTARMDAIREMQPDCVRVDAGVSLAALQEALDVRALTYPPVPTWTGATAGGVVATNAAGATTFKYGTTRDWVLALTVVLPTGDVLDLVRGEHHADAAGGFDIRRADGTVRIQVPTCRMPRVPKCSAGYHAAPGMDLIDLFIGAEGTLGVVTSVTFRVAARRAGLCHVLVPMESEARALALVGDLRRASQRTWADGDPRGIDMAGVEHMDARSMQILEEDDATTRHGVHWPASARQLLLVQLEVPPTSREEAYREISTALDANAPDSALVRFCRLLAAHDALDHAELVLPDDRRRAEQLLALREAVPAGVNRRVGQAQREIDPRIAKTAADMVVPFERFAEMMDVYREAFGQRGLDIAVWGHVSDGNVHPNVLPRSYEDVRLGQEAILACGAEVIRLGGSPLAEHGVGRHPVKQALLRLLHGDAGIEQMRAVRRALDPAGRLARGVLFA